MKNLKCLIKIISILFFFIPSFTTTASAVASITESGELSINSSDLLTSSENYIDYNIEEIILTGKINDAENTGYIINLSKETLTTPSTYTIVSYSINGGAKWKSAKSYTFSETKFSNMLIRNMTLWLSDKPIDRQTKEPESGATIVKFDKINKRQKSPSLSVKYVIVESTSDKTERAWLLSPKDTMREEINSMKAVTETVEIGIADSAKNTVDEKGFGKFRDSAANGISIKEPSDKKDQKSIYYIRYEPKKEGAIYTAASKPKKMIVSSQPKESKYIVIAAKKSLGEYVLTAYCPCVKCCEIWSKEHPIRKGTNYIQKTASGTIPKVGRTIAVDPNIIPYGTEIYIDGYGWYFAEDTGGAMKNRKIIDIYFDTHEEARQFGRQKAEVFIKR